MPSARTQSPSRHAVAVLLLLGCTTVAYSNTLDGKFVYDDFQNFVDNPAVHWFELDPAAMRDGVLAGPTRRPVAIFTFGLNFRLGRLDPFGYHVFNTVVHATNVLLVYALLLAVGRPRSETDAQRTVRWVAALLGGLLYALHPLQTQAVTYVVQRMTSMAAGFTLASLLVYVTVVRTGEGWRRVAGWSAIGLLYALGLGSKEIAAPLPFALWLYEWIVGQRADPAWARRHAAWLLPPLALALGGFAALYDSFQAEFANRDFTMGERVLTQLRVVWLYAGLVALPLPSRQNLLHLTPTSHSLVDPPATLVAAAALLATLGFALWLASRRPLSAFGILWFFLFLAVESSVVPLEMIYEHRVYLPLFGVCAIAADLFLQLPERRQLPALVAAALGLVALGALTWQRNELWREPDRIWADVYAKTGDDRALLSVAWAVEGRGQRLAAQGRNRDAIVHYRQAARIAPDYARNYRSWGESLIALGRMEGAITRFRKATELEPERWGGWDGLALSYAQLDRMPHAVAAYREVLARTRRFEDRVHTPRALVERGEGLRAIRLLEVAVATFPSDPELRGELLSLLVLAREHEAAVVHGLALLELAPSGRVHGQLALALWELGRPAPAIEQLEQALTLEPDEPIHPANLAWMLAAEAAGERRDPERALTLLDETIAAYGDDSDLEDTAAVALAALGRRDEAIARLDRALARLDPDDPGSATARSMLEERRRALTGEPGGAAQPAAR